MSDMNDLAFSRDAGRLIRNLTRRDMLARTGGLAAATAATTLGVWAPAQAASKGPRLVSCGGAITEIVYELGAQDQLAGTDTTSVYPPAALKTPKVGYLRQLSAEGLLSLKPDALIATSEAGPSVVLDQLRQAGVKVELVTTDHTWDEVLRKTAAVGRAAAREAQARDLSQKLDAQWKETAAKVAAWKGERPRVLFILAHAASPMVAGQGTAADALLSLVGAVNVMQGFKGYRPMTAEAMASAAPDFILTSTEGIEALGGEEKFWQRPELRLTPAWKRRNAGSLVHMDALQLIGFGPRMPATVSQLHERMVRG